ncbi:unnamed protein product [Allacma fusca]|uniref:Uncharacterized protein n=1 Tax=Allacma fusca TaxID=39272 RepID=A0A8J2K667_9HEXA|nr:unnamed protein product [Allacma fusca]
MVFKGEVWLLLVVTILTPGINGDPPKGTPKGFEIPKGVDTNINNWMKKDSIDPKLVETFKFGDGVKETDENGELTCIHFLKKMAVKGLPAFNECMKEMQLTIGKLKKKLKDVLPCIVKCIGKKLNILKEDGLFNFDYAKNLLNDNVPKRFMEFIWKIWDACLDYVKKLKPNDPTCKTYRPIIKCAVDAAFKVAAEAMKLCPDIPDVFKNTAKSYVKSKGQQRELRGVID